MRKIMFNSLKNCQDTNVPHNIIWFEYILTNFFHFLCLLQLLLNLTSFKVSLKASGHPLGSWHYAGISWIFVHDSWVVTGQLKKLGLFRYLSLKYISIQGEGFNDTRKTSFNVKISLIWCTNPYGNIWSIWILQFNFIYY